MLVKKVNLLRTRSKIRCKLEISKRAALHWQLRLETRCYAFRHWQHVAGSLTSESITTMKLFMIKLFLDTNKLQLLDTK